MNYLSDPSHKTVEAADDLLLNENAVKELVDNFPIFRRQPGEIQIIKDQSKAIFINHPGSSIPKLLPMHRPESFEKP